ncbi:MAG: L-rhamnose isomerase [Thermoleophilaceae bacterium]
MAAAADERSYAVAREALEAAGVEVDRVIDRLRRQRIETPSWAFGDSGTRFAVFEAAGAPRSAYERFEDAAEVHRLTGVCPSVAIHVPWDRVDDYGALRGHAESLGLEIGAVNPNLFQDPDYRLGSLCHPDPAVRQRATEHVLECIEVASAVGSDALSLWLADGTNYPGQDSFAERHERLVRCLEQVYAALPEPMRLLVEYKLYEPGFYHTDLADWGGALLVCQHLGERARVLVDLGHHAQGTNIEQIVALLLIHGRLGGFHFNARKYGDDDLIVGAVNPFELFLILFELTDADAEDVRLGLDQSHNIEPKIEASLMSVVNLQEAYAQSLLVDRAALAEARRVGDVLAAHRLVLDAYRTDVRPLCAHVRRELGAAADPVAEHRASGYAERVAQARA